MERETARRVWAAGAYRGLTPPKLAGELGVSVDTLKRIVRGRRVMRAFESEETFLRRVAEVCGLPYEFFTFDFDLLEQIGSDPALLYSEREDGRRLAVGHTQDDREKLEAAITWLTKIRDAAMATDPEAVEPDDAPLDAETDALERGQGEEAEGEGRIDEAGSP